MIEPRWWVIVILFVVQIPLWWYVYKQYRKDNERYREWKKAWDENQAEIDRLVKKIRENR